MEQASLLLQLSSSLHQLNMAVDYTGGGEEKGEGESRGKVGEVEKVRGEERGGKTRRRRKRGVRGGEQGGF